MKIHEYNEMMRYLTRPAPDPSIRQLAARMPLKPGGLVEPGVTHYAQKDPYPKKKGFVWDLDKKEFRKPKKRTGRPVTSPFVSEASNIVQAYKNYVIDAFNKGDMSATKPFSGWINSEYPKKAASVKDAVYKQKLQPEKFEIQKKKELVKKLITQANEGEKFVEIQAISKKISNRKSFKDIEWVNKKDIVDYEGNSLETREQKVSKVFDNIRNEDSLLSLSKKPAAGLKHNGIFTQLIGERSGVNTAWVIRRGLDQNAWYKDNVKSMKYLRGWHAEDFIDMPFSEAFEFADERVGHRVNYKGRSKLRMFKDPNHNIMGWALRHWDGNNFAGKKTLKQGNRIQFFDKKGNPIAWEKDLKLNMGDVSFTYDGKPMKWNIKTLKTHGPKSGLFNQVYDVTKSYFTTMNKPVTYKGKTMPFGDLMKKIYGDKPISIGHEGIGGVRGEPFKNFKIMTQKMNSALGSVMKSIPQKSLRKKMINEIFGDLKSFKGQAWTDAMVNLEVKKAGQTIKGGLTPYVQAAKNILEREYKTLSKPQITKLGSVLSRSIDNLDVSTKDILAKIHNCPTGKSSGGRIGFSPGGVVDCLKSKLKADPQGFLSKTGQTAVKTKNANILNFLRTGRNIVRGTGLFAMWEAAFIPLVSALMVPQGESGKRILYEATYGPILEAIGIPAPGISEKEEQIEYFSKPGYNVSKMNEIGNEYVNLQAQAEAEINKFAGVDYNSFKLKQIHDQMKKLKDEYLQISGTFQEGPAGQYLGDEKLNQAIGDWMTGAEKLEAQKAQNLENYKKIGGPDQVNLGFFPEGLAQFRNYNTGGRVGFKLGGIDKGRRAFMKWLAGITGAGVAAGTGLLKWGKIGGKGTTAIKAGDKIIQGTPGMPDWFIPLINRIVKEGDDVTAKLATKEREIVHTKNIEGHDVDVYQDLTTGDIRVSVEGGTGKNLTAYDEGLQLEYTAPVEDITSKGKPFKTDPDFQVMETEAGYYRTGPDDVDLDISFNTQGQPTKYDSKKMTYVVDESKASTDEILSDTNFLKNYAKKKKPNMGQIVETSKKKKEIKYLNKNPHEDPRIPEGPEPDYDDYLPGIDDLD